jgi:uncharacterized protein with ParB-like and HNH nuclease domain
MPQFNDITIKKVMKEINVSYFVPDIQREYVWLSNPKEEKIEKLFDSLLRGYPIGSFLIWKLTKKEVETDDELKNIQLYKFVEDYHEQNKHNEKISIKKINSEILYIIVDGQQRLTSLYIGLRGSRTLRKKGCHASNPLAYVERTLHINLKHVPNSDNPKDNYEFKFLSDNERYSVDETKSWFKVSEILGMESDDDITSYSEKHSLNDDERDILRKMRMTFCENEKISYFEETDKKLEKVLNIFIRVNSGGKPLSHSDLLMSILTSKFEDDIRRFMNDLVDSLEKAGFGGMGRDQVLKTCLLLTDSPHVFNLKNFSNENISKIEDNWSKIQESIWFAVELLSDYGYKYQLSSAYILSTIALFHFRHNKKPDNEDKRQIINFVKMAQIKSYFTVALDNKLDTIKNNIKECKSFLEFNKKMSTRTDKYQLYITDDDIKGFEHLQYGDPSTFPVLQTLYPYLTHANKEFHIDHIYPKSEFKKNNNLKDYLGRENELFNLQLLEGKDNNNKRAKEPEKWLKEKYQTEDDIKTYKRENYIEEDLPLEWGNIKKFEEYRSVKLIDELKKKFALIRESFMS